jgi:3-oxoisoapionate decarboxylase
VALHVGTGSICPTSSMFDPRRGSAEDHLRLTVEVAKALGSPVARCFLGRGEDRATHGGIESHMRNTIATCKAIRSYAVDSKVKVAIENHAGDMQAWEVVSLIHEAGRDFVGATMDSGNATWTMEDPVESLETLAPYAVTTGIRDSAVWESSNGATVQWVAMGDGLVDWKAYVARFGQLCPETPFILEIISGGPREFPYLKKDFWREWPRVRGPEFARFVAMAKRGLPRPTPSDPESGAFQKAELERSLRYCRETLGLGTR